MKSKKKPGKRKAVGALALFLCLMLGFIIGAGWLLTPHQRAENPEAFLLQDYLESTPGRDVIFLGDCEVFDSFSPAVLWEDYGINARVCGTPQQLLWHSETILHEIFERENPAPTVIVLSVYALRYSTPQSEAYNRMALEALPWSWAKIRTILTASAEGETLLSYFLPLLRYHDRWQSLTAADFSALFAKSEPISYSGYLFDATVIAGEYPNHDGAAPLNEAGFGTAALEALERIVTLCRQEGAELILVKAPTDSWRYPWYSEWEAETVALAAEYGLPYYNFLTAYSDIGLDPATDTRDGGYRLNAYGAEKLTRYFGAILADTYNIPDRRGENAALDAAWERELARYRAAWEEVSEQ